MTILGAPRFESIETNCLMVVDTCISDFWKPDDTCHDPQPNARRPSVVQEMSDREFHVTGFQWLGDV